RIRIGPKDRPAASLALLTPKPLLAITRSAILHDFCTLPMRTPHGFQCHRLSSFRATPSLGPTPSSVHDDSLSYSNQQIRHIANKQQITDITSKHGKGKEGKKRTRDTLGHEGNSHSKQHVQYHAEVHYKLRVVRLTILQNGKQQTVGNV